MPQFERYIGIDYSCDETPESICKGYGVTLPRVSGE
jgi:hypothetical protein